MNWIVAGLLSILVLPSTLIAAQSQGRGSNAPSRDSSGPEGTPRATAAIWIAVLERISHSGARSEAGTIVETSRLLGADDEPDTPPVVLLLAPSDSTLSSQAVADLLSRRVVDGVCREADAFACPDTTLTSYLTFSSPHFATETSATVSVEDRGLNPTACRSVMGLWYTGFVERTYFLHSAKERWSVDSVVGVMSGSGACGHRLPAEQAAYDQMEAEDSVVEATPVPIAGTYRFEFRLPSGEADSVYCRTARYPHETLRGWRLDDVTERDLPIAGYYVRSICSLERDSLEASFKSRASMPLNFSVSWLPVLSSADSVMWRGDSEAQSAIYVLRDDEPFLQRLRASISDEGRDPDAYFMPGWWTSYPDGRVTFVWKSVRDGMPMFSIRGERISLETLW